jgi:hypothetical protein
MNERTDQQTKKRQKQKNKRKKQRNNETKELHKMVFDSWPKLREAVVALALATRKMAAKRLSTETSSFVDFIHACATRGGVDAHLSVFVKELIGDADEQSCSSALHVEHSHIYRAYFSSNIGCATVEFQHGTVKRQLLASEVCVCSNLLPVVQWAMHLERLQSEVEASRTLTDTDLNDKQAVHKLVTLRAFLKCAPAVVQLASNAKTFIESVSDHTFHKAVMAEAFRRMLDFAQAAAVAIEAELNAADKFLSNVLEASAVVRFHELLVTLPGYKETIGQTEPLLSCCGDPAAAKLYLFFNKLEATLDGLATILEHSDNLVRVLAPDGDVFKLHANVRNLILKQKSTDEERKAGKEDSSFVRAGMVLGSMTSCQVCFVFLFFACFLVCLF